jgi:preprotein translocase subunit SecD
MSRSSNLLVAAGAAVLGFALVASRSAAAPACANAGWVLVEAKASPETRMVKAGPRSLFVRRTQITTTADLTEIKLAGDAYDTQVQMKFTPEAARRLRDATTNKDGLRIAFVVDDKALSAVTWTGPYGMDADLGVQISLGRATPEVRPLVEAVQGCIRSNAK